MQLVALLLTREKEIHIRYYNSIISKIYINCQMLQFLIKPIDFLFFPQVKEKSFLIIVPLSYLLQIK